MVQLHIPVHDVVFTDMAACSWYTLYQNEVWRVWQVLLMLTPAITSSFITDIAAFKCKLKTELFRQHLTTDCEHFISTPGRLLKVALGKFC